MIDEAHALGVVGPTGRGTAEIYGLEGQIDVTVGTLSKAPGGIGGYATGSKELIDYLRYYARTYFFSTSIPAPVIAGLIEVFAILESEPQRNRRLWANIRYMTGRLTEMGFDLGKTVSAIIPIMVNDEDKLKRKGVDRCSIRSFLRRRFSFNRLRFYCFRKGFSFHFGPVRQHAPTRQHQ